MGVSRIDFYPASGLSALHPLPGVPDAVGGHAGSVSGTPIGRAHMAGQMRRGSR